MQHGRARRARAHMHARTQSRTRAAYECRRFSGQLGCKSSRGLLLPRSALVAALLTHAILVGSGLKEFMAHGRGKNIHKIVKAYVMIVKGKKEKTMRRQAGAKDEAGDSAGKEVHGTLDPSTMQQVHSGGGPGD